MVAERKQRIAAGLTLIALGGVLYLLDRSVGIDSAAVLLIIGGAFLAYYFYKREYGLLIPACIMLGLGTGTVVSHTRYDYGQPTLWGLGLGFIAIFVIAWIYTTGKSLVAADPGWHFGIARLTPHQRNHRFPLRQLAAHSGGGRHCDSHRGVPTPTSILMGTVPT